MSRVAVLLCRFTLLFIAVPLLASEVATSITPDRGPSSGGTEVTIRGNFGGASYGVYFGATLVPATVADTTRLVVTTPPHLPGPAPITIYHQTTYRPTDLVFTFTGSPEAAFDALLLPVFTLPIRGAYGSEFRSDLRVRLVKESAVAIHGLRLPCMMTCIQGPFEPYVLDAEYPEAGPDDLEPTGDPGTFVYVAKGHSERLAMNLRAYDTSKGAENFGTEIPIVPLRDFAEDDEAIALIGIPSDSRFRNMLRIYGYGELGAVLNVVIDGDGGFHSETRVLLPARINAFRPGYVELRNFPVNAGTLRVRIEVDVPRVTTPPPLPARWAFVTVTNNETHQITTITPHP